MLARSDCDQKAEARDGIPRQVSGRNVRETCNQGQPWVGGRTIRFRKLVYSRSAGLVEFRLLNQLVFLSERRRDPSHSLFVASECSSD